MKKLGLALLLATLTAGCGQGVVPSVAGQTSASKAHIANRSETSLQLHVRFFDRNGDGVIMPAETVESLKTLGVGPIQGRLFATGLHAVLGPKTSGKMSSGVVIKNIHVGVHDGSINFTKEGAFRASSFTQMFADFDTNRSGSLSKGEISVMLKAKRKSATSYHLSRTAFWLLMAVAGDTKETLRGETEPALSRARLESFYDGTLFYKVADARAQAGKSSPVDVSDVDFSLPPEAENFPVD